MCTRLQFSLFSSQTRIFLREDTLLVKKVKKEKTTFSKHHFFLFNDILLNTVTNKEGKFKLVEVYPLAESSFQKYEGDSDTVALFRITAADATVEELAKAIHVKASKNGDIEGWLQDVLKAKANGTADQLAHSSCRLLALLFSPVRSNSVLVISEEGQDRYQVSV